MNRPDAPHYRGVSFHKRRGKWRAAFRYRDKDIYLGCYANPELAAWVVDLARYLLVGLNPRAYHFKMDKPNFSPHMRPDFPRAVILQKLAASGLISAEQLRDRLAAFDAACVESCASS